MTSQHLNQILCAGQPGGSSDGAERILEAASGEGAEAIALVGDLAHDPDGCAELHAGTAELAELSIAAR